MSSAAAQSAASTNSSKVSKFAAKSGFVIPKNKLSGSLVPIFRGNKKLVGNDTADDESNKQVQRKTKWGPDLMQDAAVRKGRALAYQARVDQITQQLRSGALEFDDNLNSSPAEQWDESSSGHRLDAKKTKLLELERLEVIGEILKLNANYKVPPDYKPLLKEDRVLMPIKEFPGYNFLGLIFGPGGDNRKRLEKETGAKIQVYGVKPGKEKGEVIPYDANDFQGVYEEIYVQVTAETFDKVDAAVSIIELLVSSVSGNLASTSGLSAATAVDKNNAHDGSTPINQLPVVTEGLPHSMSGSSQTPPEGQFQYTVPWFPGIPTSIPTPSGSVPPPRGSAPVNLFYQPSPLNPPNMPSLYGPQAIGGFTFPPQNTNIIPPRLQQTPQVLQNPYMQQPRPSDVGTSIRNPVAPASHPSSAPFPFTGSQPLQTGPASVTRPPLAQPLTNAPPVNFPSGPTTPSSFPMQPNHPPVLGPTFASGPPSQPISVNPLPSRSHAPPFQSGPNSFSGVPNFPPMRASAAATAPNHPTFGDFTFQPHRPQASQPFPPGPGNQPSAHIMAANQTQQPRGPPFHSGGPDPQPRMQAFSRLPMVQPQPGSSIPGRAPSFPTMNPNAPPPPVHQVRQQMNFAAATQMPSPASAFPPRPRNFMEPQQLYRMQMAPRDILSPPSRQFGHNLSFGPRNRAPGPGELQVYDPFSPTSVSNAPQRQGDNSGTGRRRENDPEYEDLMASVGVK